MLTRPTTLFTLLLLAAGQAFGQTEDFQRVTLDQAVQAALKVSPDVTAAQGSVSTSAAAQRSAFGAYLPTLSATANGSLTPYGRVNTETGTVFPINARASINANYELFTGFRRGADQAAADAAARAAATGLISARANLALVVEQSFYEALRAKELVAVVEAQKKRAEQGLEAANKRLAAGSATRSDVLRAQLEVNSAQQQLLEQHTAHRSAAFALGRLMGLDKGATPDAVDSQAAGTEVSYDRAQVVEKLVNEAPMVRAAEAQLDSASAGVNAALSRYYPSLSANAGYSVNYAGSTQNGPTVGLSLSYPIFDGFQREEQVERARVTERNARAIVADTRRQVRAEAERAVAAVVLAQQKVKLAREAVEAAREDLRVQEERYKLGATTMLELLTSQASVVQAESSLIGARFDFELAKASLSALAGELS